MGWLETRIPPPVVILTLAALMWLFAPPSPHGGGIGALGVAVAALGVGVEALAGLEVRRLGTTVNPLHPERARALSTGGVYALSRNPMYLGMTLLLTGWALWLGAVWLVFGPAAFVAFIGRFQIAPEERAISAKFGADYDAYRARVRRWI